MILDTSAVLVLLFGEPEQVEFSDIIEASAARLISSVDWYECAVVARTRKGAGVLAKLEALRAEIGLQVMGFRPDHADAAIHAHGRFGKGVHPAALNFADCCAYATAVVESMTMLFKGDDFSRTDVPSAAHLWAGRNR